MEKQKILIVGGGAVGSIAMLDAIAISEASNRKVNVGTIGHVDHGEKLLTVDDNDIMRMLISAPPELPDIYLKEDPRTKTPYYREFEKKKRW